MFASDTVVDGGDRYWADSTAAVPVLLIDEATEAKPLRETHPTRRPHGVPTGDGLPQSHHKNKTTKPPPRHGLR